MSPEQLIAWRKRLGLTAKAAAEALDLSINGYAAYERGWAVVPCKGHPLISEKALRPIPKHVALACAALEAGLISLPTPQ